MIVNKNNIKIEIRYSKGFNNYLINFVPNQSMLYPDFLKKLKPTKNIVDWIKAIGIALLVILLLRFFFIESYTIPTTSMEKTLIEGDYIIVSKISYGARIPITLLSLPFFSKVYSVAWQLPYLRVPGFSDIKTNDVIVFNYPIEDEKPVDKRTPFVKRCIAAAGDTLKIVDGKVYVNSKLIEEPDDAEFNFLVKTDSSQIDPSELEKLGITEGGPMMNLTTYNLTMTRRNAEIVNKFKNVKSVEIMCEDSGLFAENLYPSSMYYTWNMDNYGPIIIPEKGATVKLTKINLPLYYRIISAYEGNSLVVKNDSICEINGKPSKTYTFKMNYYFALGDNRHNSADSRFWGFVPEDHIIGKAVMILFSVDRSKNFFSGFRWNRLFKIIK